MRRSDAPSHPMTVEEEWDLRRQLVGRKVLALIESRRMSFADASHATSLSKTGLYKIVDGASDPSLSSLYKIADFFGVSVADLLPSRQEVCDAE